ncbi:MAG: heparinase II/III family protein [Bacteroidales bacterium]|nr:heparinase II/III family protein [Bacteroidales bacterium]
MRSKSFLLFVLAALLLSVPAAAQSRDDFDCSRLTARNHPRLFLNAEEFKHHKKVIYKGGYASELHALLMKVAAREVENESPLEYKRDASGKRILYVSNAALTRISALAYAYRFTGNKAYLRKAEWNMNAVCDFPDWNPSHFLDPSEMALAVAIGFDWLYGKLSGELQSKAASRLAEYALEEAVHGQGQHVFKRAGNWNQVCIASMTAAAIATYELNPELSMEVFRRGLEGNRPAAEAIYSPDGAFPEGPGYWEYGTCFQEMLILLYEGAFGTDFGLCDTPGFSKTGLFKAFSRNAAGHVFNYSDSSDRLVPSPGIWYLAWKFGTPEILCDELQFLSSDAYMADRRLFLAVVTASRLDNVKISAPKQRLYVSQGRNPILIAKAGWGKNDLYLGLKGGSASVGHSHLDVGSFVFDAYGTRWVADYYVRNYQKYENMCKDMNIPLKEFSNVRQGSLRWKLFIYNNRQHSTLTVNDHDHVAAGFASVEDSWDEGGKLGGRVGLSGIFEGDLQSASRSASIVDDSYLEIIDSLQALQTTPAKVRFTIVTPVKPLVKEGEGIVLNDGSTTMVLNCDAPGAVFKIWSSNPKDYDSPTAPYEDKIKGHWICGYEYELSEGSSVSVRTTICKR